MTRPTGALLLAWNEFWVDLPVGPVPDCPAGCELTTDRTRLDQADAVLFHLPTLGPAVDVPKGANQRWVALSMESDINYPRQADPAFMRRFDVTMTYRRTSDIPVLYAGPGLPHDLRSPVREKTEAAPAVYFASNRATRSGREHYIADLMNFVAVDSYGASLHNRDLPADNGRETKLSTIAQYLFTLAFENSIGADYVTEKFFDPLVSGSVPVYLGAPNIDDFAPGEHCYIAVSDFAGPRELATYLNQLAADPDEYRAYHAWRDRDLRTSFMSMTQSQRTHPTRKLCGLLSPH